MNKKATIAELLPDFFEYLRAERKCAPETIKTYKKCMAVVLSVLGDLRPKEVQLRHFISLRARLSERGASDAHIATVTSVLKTFLRYATDIFRTAFEVREGEIQRHGITADAHPGEARTSPGTSKGYVGESNFDELTPEQQECVRERLARFFISVFEHE